MPEGKVLNYDAERGLGTIESETGEELPVHVSALIDQAATGLHAGDAVSFKVGRNKFGRRAALQVQRIGWEEGDDPDGPPREWSF